MRVLVITERPPFPDRFGGIEVSLHHWLGWLKREGHEATWLATVSPTDRRWRLRWAAMRLLTLRRGHCLREQRPEGTVYRSDTGGSARRGFPATLRRLLVEGRWDAITAADRMGPPTIEVLASLGVRPSFKVHDVLPGYFIPPVPVRGRLLANSAFVRNRIRRDHGIEAEVLYPPIDMAAVVGSAHVARE